MLLMKSLVISSETIHQHSTIYLTFTSIGFPIKVLEDLEVETSNSIAFSMCFSFVLPEWKSKLRKVNQNIVINIKVIELMGKTGDLVEQNGVVFKASALWA